MLLNDDEASNLIPSTLIGLSLSAYPDCVVRGEKIVQVSDFHKSREYMV
jgi:hypothetical protein